MELPSPFEKPAPRRPRRSFVRPLVLLAACGVYLAASGEGEIRHAFAHPTNGASLVIIAAIVIGAVVLASLFVRIGRGTPPEQPQFRGADLADTSPTVGTPRPATSAAPSPAMPTRTAAPNRDVSTQPKIGPTRLPAIIGVVVALGTLGIAGLRIVLAADDFEVVAPKIGRAFDPTCPSVKGGGDLLDNADTDCTALDVADFYERGQLVRNDDRQYRVLATDQTDLCPTIAATPADRAVLERTECITVIRALASTTEQDALGAVSLAVFPTRAQALVALKASGPNRSLVTSLATPETVDLPPRIDQLKPTTACIASVGRYVICSHAAGATPTSATPEQRQAFARDLSFLAIDGLVARRFKSI